MGNYFGFRNHKIHYQIFGAGKDTMLAFHGFNRDCNDFREFESSIGKKYKIYSFDLFYHGKSEISGNETVFGPDDLKQFILEFTQYIHEGHFSLLGYSLGGKMALKTIEFFPEKIRDVFLFAPYGVKQNEIVRILEKFKFTGKIFHSLILNPRPFFSTIGFLHSIKLMSDNLFGFLEHQMESEERRKKLFFVWKSYMNIRPDIFNIQNLINKHKISLHLYYGIFDPIEPPANGRIFVSRLKDKNSLRVVPLTHNLVCNKMNEILEKEFSETTG